MSKMDLSLERRLVFASNHRLRAYAPLNHVSATPARVLLHLHLAFTEHLGQLGEEPLVPLDGALKLPERENKSEFCWSWILWGEEAAFQQKVYESLMCSLHLECFDLTGWSYWQCQNTDITQIFLRLKQENNVLFFYLESFFRLRLLSPLELLSRNDLVGHTGIQSQSGMCASFQLIDQ